MNATRRLRLQSQVQRELSKMLSNGFWDERLSGIMVSHVELSPDAGLATVYFSALYAALEDHKRQTILQDAKVALDEVKADLRRSLARAMNTRYIPELTFRMDQGFENAERVSHLLREIESTSSLI